MNSGPSRSLPNKMKRSTFQCTAMAQELLKYLLLQKIAWNQDILLYCSNSIQTSHMKLSPPTLMKVLGSRFQTFQFPHQHHREPAPKVYKHSQDILNSCLLMRLLATYAKSNISRSFTSICSVACSTIRQYSPSIFSTEGSHFCSEPFVCRSEMRKY